MANARSSVASENKYEYKDKLAGKHLKFEAATDEIVATFEESSTAEAMTALSGRSDSAVYLSAPDQGFAVLRSGAPTETSAALAAEPQVANAIPVMIDMEGLRRYFLPDEFTVQFTDSLSPTECEDALKKMGISVRKKQRTPGYYTVGVPEGAGLFESIDAMSKLNEVIFAEPSEFGPDDELTVATKNESEALPEPLAEIEVLTEPLSADPDNPVDDDSLLTDEDEIPGDSLFPQLWGLHNTGQTVNRSSGSFDADIDAPQAWNIERGKRHVVCAVIDTGCDLDHPDLAANLLPRGSEDWDFADVPDKSPDDGGSHGTHVAGTIAARRNNAGVIGVAPGAYVMPLRINLQTGMNQNRADAINYVAAQAVRFKSSRRYVINCSWRMNGDHAGVRNAIINATSKNVLIVFAAGNANTNIDSTPQYPAIYPQVISVAATDQRDQRATFSNYGKKVDVAAPGVNIYSTVPNNTWGFKNGTSMASPHVAGVAALIWSRNPDLSSTKVRKCIEATTDNIDAKNPGFAGKLGTGRVNAFRALLHTPPRQLPVKLLARFKFPQKNAGSSTGLTYVRSFPIKFFGRRPVLLFLSQQAGSERIYFLNPANGAVLGSIDPVVNDTIGSLAWDGSSIRAANVTTGSGSINKINPVNGMQISSISAPPGRGEGLEVVGSRIYYSTIRTIYELSAATGAVINSFPAPEGEARGLTYGRRLLFTGNSSAGRILAIDRATHVVQGIIRAPGGGSNQAEGLAFNPYSRILYVANQSENMIYALRVGGI